MIVIRRANQAPKTHQDIVMKRRKKAPVITTKISQPLHSGVQVPMQCRQAISMSLQLSKMLSMDQTKCIGVRPFKQNSSRCKNVMIFVLPSYKKPARNRHQVGV